MKILLAGINAKYIHSNPAIHSLRSVVKSGKVNVELGEYTINHSTEAVRSDIYSKKPDVICFSCYIWNISYVEILIRDLKKLMPKLDIWLGGPEVSYNAPEMLERFPQITGIMTGPGEETFRRLTDWYGTRPSSREKLREIPGMVYRGDRGEILDNGESVQMALSDIPFWYNGMQEFENRIVYYESSRGCPFSCSYCLSSIDKTMQFRDLNLVFRELRFFLDQKVPQVKFIDRTFNCRESHALAIWKYLADNDNGITNFHFEIAADLLTENEMEVLREMRPGLVQLEIGVQSTNPKTVKEIHRVMDVEKLAERVAKVKSWHNIHQHLDLIAGLPFEDYESFGRSFDDVYRMEPDQLQLGFLKVLKGSWMEKQAERYGLVYTTEPPYEVMSSRWMTYDEILRLKGVEAMVEIFYNSGQFTETLRQLEKQYDRPFVLYEDLAEFWKEKGYDTIHSSRIRKYELLLQFIQEHFPEQTELFRELLTMDCYLRENMKSRPGFAPIQREEDWKQWKDFLQQEAKEHSHFPGYIRASYRELLGALHEEVLRQGREEPVIAVFDYQNRDPLTGNAAVAYYGQKDLIPVKK
ncbi:MAG: B12-binding domain-containing radical SAM protein [Clostridiales bacterium]|nr:B12-binding domain-containing radical SAM protein [Clostridiales bacterium]